MSFWFVERITAVDAQHARAQSCRLEGAGAPPMWLVIEAIGQLACWIAAARTDFVSRPIAALVRQVILADAPATDRLTLEAQIERVDGRAVLYGGRALAGASEVAVLSGGVGPLLPIGVFDDPEDTRARFAALCAAGAGTAPLRPTDLPRPDLRSIALDGSIGRAELWVPESAPFFADHFPRRPVYPASLFADAQNQLGRLLIANRLGIAVDDIAPARISDFKVRAFSPPGQRIELTAEARPESAGPPVVAMTACADGKRIATSVIEYRLRRAAR